MAVNCSVAHNLFLFLASAYAQQKALTHVSLRAGFWSTESIFWRLLYALSRLSIYCDHSFYTDHLRDVYTDSAKVYAEASLLVQVVYDLFARFPVFHGDTFVYLDRKLCKIGVYISLEGRHYVAQTSTNFVYFWLYFLCFHSSAYWCLLSCSVPVLCTVFLCLRSNAFRTDEMCSLLEAFGKTSQW